MPRFSSALVVAVLCACCAPGAQAAEFPDGVASGDVSSTSARLWTRSATAGRLELVVSRTADLAHPVARRSVTARAAARGAVTATVTRLEAGRRYYFRFLRGAVRSRIGRFVTPPAPSAERVVRFAVAAGFDAAADPGLGIVDRLARRNPSFTVLLGDTSSDAALGTRAVRSMRAKGGLYATWDAAERAQGRAAFERTTPVRWRSGVGYYRSIRWGRAVELFLLDERSFRSPAPIAPQCVNSYSGRLDIAPTLSADLRRTYADFFAPYIATVDDLCTTPLRSPQRTMLGAQQLRALRQGLERSDARFKVILSETPLKQLYLLPYDRWEGYEAERAKLVGFLRENVENALVLSAGGAGGIVGQMRLRTFEAPGTDSSGIDEVGLGPAAGPTFRDRVVEAMGHGNPDGLTEDFMSREPTFGLGMRCVAVRTRSYADVRVSKTAMTVSLLAADGKPIADAAGRPCGPLRYSTDEVTTRAP
jgi:alkaline phosphatase D